MTGVIQLFTRRGAHDDARRTVPRSRAASSRPRAAPAGIAGEGRTLRLLRGRGALHDRQRGAEQRVRQHDAVGRSAGVALGHGATLRFVGRAERGTTGTPGQTAFGRPDLDAFFKRHDGVGGVTFDQAAGAVAPARDLRRRRVAPDVDQSAARSALHAVVRGTHRAVRVLRLRLRQPHGPAPPPRQLPGRRHARRRRRAGTHVETALVDWDGERATLSDALAGTTSTRRRATTSASTLQHQALWSRVFVTGRRPRSSTTTASAPRPCRASRPRGTRAPAATPSATTRLQASAGHGHQGADACSSRSAHRRSSSATRTSSPSARARRRRHRAAARARSACGWTSTWFDNRYRDIIAPQTIDLRPSRRSTSTSA